MNLKKSNSISAAWKSTILLALTLFPLTFLHMLFHEGGHALAAMVYGAAEIQIYVHPFAFSGYSRPILDMGSNLYHVAGSLTALVIPLVIFLFARRLQSPASLFLVMLLPWSIFLEGLNFLSILLGTGDFYNLSQASGLPVVLFAVLGLILLFAGILLIDAFLPQAGLNPDNFHTLWAVPTGLALWVLPGIAIARWVVPGSRFAIRYQLVPEIIEVANLWLIIMIGAGLLIAIAHVMLYRMINRRILVHHGQHTVILAWRNLAWPAVWAFASISAGLVFIL